MRFERCGDDLVAWAPAKVNLFLEILGKRSDGYHELTTLMVAVNLYDTLTFSRNLTGQLSLSSSHPHLSTGSDNLVLKAARLLQQETQCNQGASIHLEKRIPMQGGLAGGSTDAAATLLALNQLWDLRLTRDEISVLCAKLGSDIAFFLHTPAAWCTGRGEVVESLHLGVTLWLVLLCPPLGVSTPEVYRQLQVPGQPRNGEKIRQSVEAGDIEQIAGSLYNRLEEVAERICPDLHRYQEWLRDQQPTGQLLSGSGSTLFALCGDQREAQTIAHKLRQEKVHKDAQIFVVRTLS